MCLFRRMFGFSTIQILEASHMAKDPMIDNISTMSTFVIVFTSSQIAMKASPMANSLTCFMELMCSSRSSFFSSRSRKARKFFLTRSSSTGVSLKIWIQKGSFLFFPDIYEEYRKPLPYQAVLCPDPETNTGPPPHESLLLSRSFFSTSVSHSFLYTNLCQTSSGLLRISEDFILQHFVLHFIPDYVLHFASYFVYSFLCRRKRTKPVTAKPDIYRSGIIITQNTSCRAE